LGYIRSGVFLIQNKICRSAPPVSLSLRAGPARQHAVSTWPLPTASIRSPVSASRQPVRSSPPSCRRVLQLSATSPLSVSRAGLRRQPLLRRLPSSSPRLYSKPVSPAVTALAPTIVVTPRWICRRLTPVQRSRNRRQCRWPRCRATAPARVPLTAGPEPRAATVVGRDSATRVGRCRSRCRPRHCIVGPRTGNRPIGLVSSLFLFSEYVQSFA
jgi:hypothetical protein